MTTPTCILKYQHGILMHVIQMFRSFKYFLKTVNPSGAKTRLFQDNQVDTIAVGALVYCVTSPSAAISG